MQKAVTLAPGSRFFLLDLDAVRGGQPQVLASACKCIPLVAASRQSAADLMDPKQRRSDGTPLRPPSLSLVVEGVTNTPAVLLLRAPSPPRSVTLAGQELETVRYSPEDRLLWIRFTNEARQRELRIEF